MTKKYGKVPKGWKIVRGGVTQRGDKTWNPTTEKWDDLYRKAYVVNHSIVSFEDLRKADGRPVCTNIVKDYKGLIRKEKDE